MTQKEKEWFYADEEKGEWAGPITHDELDTLRKEGKIESYTHVYNKHMPRPEGLGWIGMPYSMISRILVEFSPSVEEFYDSRKDKMTTVLSGPNNCGKTLLLKKIFSLVGYGGYLIACSRFSHVNTLNSRNREEDEHRHYYNNFIQQLYSSQNNDEKNELQLERIITNLNSKQREKLFSICKDLLGNTFSLKRTDTEDEFSPCYIDMDGENLKYGSSGTRLLLTLIGILLDENFTVILIDEPEIGLSPSIQTILARFLYDQEQRQQLFPHLSQLYIATHSHLFLDRRTLSNNYVVTKTGPVIYTKPVQSIGDFHQLQFNMLGNDLESIFLPSSIMIVEGDSDVIFLSKVVQLHIPDRKVAIVRANGDGGVLEKLNIIKEAFGNLEKSPFRTRMFVVLDKRNSARLDRIEKQGVPKQNIIVWSKNGIEYYYPSNLVAQVFSCDISELEKFNLEDDPIEFNDISKTKKELAQLISEQITKEHSLDPEVLMLLEKIKSACS